MEDQVVKSVVAQLRSEVTRIRAIKEHRAALEAGRGAPAVDPNERMPAFPTSNQNGSAPSAWKKVKRIGNVPRDCSRFVRRHVRQWLGAGSSLQSESPWTWKKIKRIGNIPRDCSRFVRRHVRQWFEFVTQSKGNIAAIQAQLGKQADLCRDMELQITMLQDRLLEQGSRVSELLDDFRLKILEPAAFAEEFKRRLDSLYVAFEDRFRGAREDIKERLQVYVPLLLDSGLSKEDMPALDVGCGRGEWLELLREHGYRARGIDSNLEMVKQCHERGLDVAAGDALALLHDIPDASLGVVTAFHVIEHLPLDMLLELLREAVRVLKPGGLAIFETPNPDNILVGSCTFYYDPTHRNPLPWPLAQFLVEAVGLGRTQIMKLHPRTEDFGSGQSELVDKFRDFFCGPQDYAVIGWKADAAGPADCSCHMRAAD